MIRDTSEKIIECWTMLVVYRVAFWYFCYWNFSRMLFKFQNFENVQFYYFNHQRTESNCNWFLLGTNSQIAVAFDRNMKFFLQKRLSIYIKINWLNKKLKKMWFPCYCITLVYFWKTCNKGDYKVVDRELLQCD